MTQLHLHVYYGTRPLCINVRGPKQKTTKQKKNTTLADLNFNLKTRKKNKHLVKNTMAGSYTSPFCLPGSTLYPLRIINSCRLSSVLYKANVHDCASYV